MEKIKELSQLAGVQVGSTVEIDISMDFTLREYQDSVFKHHVNIQVTESIQELITVKIAVPPRCEGCVFRNTYMCGYDKVPCSRVSREDKQNVIFVVDYVKN